MNVREQVFDNDRQKETDKERKWKRKKIEEGIPRQTERQKDLHLNLNRFLKSFFARPKNFFLQNSCDVFIYFLLEFKRDMEKLVMKERERKHE